MAIFTKNKEISSIYASNKSVVCVYKGDKLLWEAVNSCFGKGYWIDEKPWNNEDAWKNNI